MPMTLKTPRHVSRDPRFDPQMSSDNKSDPFSKEKYAFLRDYATAEMDEIKGLLKTKRLSKAHANKDPLRAEERETLWVTLRKMEQEQQRSQAATVQRSALQSAKKAAWEKGAYLKRGQQKGIEEQARLRHLGVRGGQKELLNDIDLEKGSTKKMVERKRKKEFAKEVKAGLVPKRR